MVRADKTQIKKANGQVCITWGNIWELWKNCLNTPNCWLPIQNLGKVLESVSCDCQLNRETVIPAYSVALELLDKYVSLTVSRSVSCKELKGFSWVEWVWATWIVPWIKMSTKAATLQREKKSKILMCRFLFYNLVRSVRLEETTRPKCFTITTYPASSVPSGRSRVRWVKKKVITTFSLTATTFTYSRSFYSDSSLWLLDSCTQSLFRLCSWNRIQIAPLNADWASLVQALVLGSPHTPKAQPPKLRSELKEVDW